MTQAMIEGFQHLFAACVTWTGGYGSGLAALSLLVKIFLVPFRRYADVLARDEREIRDVLAPQRAHIRRTSHDGAERHRRTVALFRRYGYSPWLALRNGAPLGVQLPVLLLAYAALNTYGPLHGIACGPLPDLGAPDGSLPGGANALPFAMTLVHFAALRATPGMGRRERLHGAGLGVLFLILLYDAPSSLLLYWTFNNGWTLAGHLLALHGADLAAATRTVSLPRRAAAVSMARTGVPVAIGLGLTILWGEGHFAPIYISSTPGRPVIPFALTVGTALALSLMAVVPLTVAGARWKWRSTVMAGLIWAGVFVIIRNIPTMRWSWNGVWLLLTGASCLTGWGALVPWWRRLPMARPRVSPFFLDASRAGTVYGAAVACGGAWMFGALPALMLRADPHAFDAAAMRTVLPSMTAWGAGLAVAAVWLWAMCPRAARGALAMAAGLVTFFILVNGMVPASPPLRINGLRLEDTGGGVVEFREGRDLLVLAVAGAVLAGVGRTRRWMELARGLRWTTVVFLGLAVWTAATLQRTPPSGMTDPSVPSSDGRVYAFSRTAPNYLYVIVDTFRGEDFGRLMAEGSAWAPSYAGFTWYRDTVAPGHATIFSIPPMLGGPAFAPAAINADPSVSRVERTRKAFAVLPDFFRTRGLAVRTCSPVDLLRAPGYPEDGDAGTPPAPVDPADTPGNDDIRIVHGVPTRHRAAWDRRIGFEERSVGSLARYYATLALFRVAPARWKSALYGDGNWLGAVREVADAMQREVVDHAMSLGMLAEASDFDYPRGAYNLVYSAMVHSPCLFPPDRLVPDRREYTYRDSERHALRLLAAFFDAMRRAGVYDNTTIVVASDHAGLGATTRVKWTFTDFFRQRNRTTNATDVAALAALGDLAGYAGQFDGLLLVKPRGARAALAVSDHPMATAEVPALFRCAARGEDPMAWTEGLDPNRPRVYAYNGHWNFREHPETHYKDLGLAEVRGSRDVPAHWRVLTVPKHKSWNR